jgi:hypothetical protein
MIIGHRVLKDSASEHLAYVDLRPPFPLRDVLILPAGKLYWNWVVLLGAATGEDFPPVRLTAWHRRPPHAGELSQKLPIEILPGADPTTNDAPQRSLRRHGLHVDWLVSEIRVQTVTPPAHRLWILLTHTATQLTPVIPANPLAGALR